MLSTFAPSGSATQAALCLRPFFGSMSLSYCGPYEANYLAGSLSPLRRAGKIAQEAAALAAGPVEVPTGEHVGPIWQARHFGLRKGIAVHVWFKAVLSVNPPPGMKDHRRERSAFEANLRCLR